MWRVQSRHPAILAAWLVAKSATSPHRREALHSYLTGGQLIGTHRQRCRRQHTLCQQLPLLQLLTYGHVKICKTRSTVLLHEHLNYISDGQGVNVKTKNRSCYYYYSSCRGNVNSFKLEPASIFPPKILAYLGHSEGEVKALQRNKSINVQKLRSVQKLDKGLYQV